MFSKLRRSKSEAAAHQPPKKQNVLRGMPALKLLRKSKNHDAVAQPFNTSLTTLTESERLGLPSKEGEMKYIGPKSHLEDESAPDSHNLNGNLNSRVSNTPTNMNNLRERHKVVVGKVGDINNIDRFKGMSFEQKESLMYYNEIISTKPAEQNIDDSYLTPTSHRTRPKKDTRKGHGLHSVKKRRRESREAHKDMIALTPKERESILFLDGILKLEEESFTAINTDDNEEDAMSETNSTGSIIDMIGDLKSLTPSPNIKHKEKTFALPEPDAVGPPTSATDAVEVMGDKLDVQKPKKHKKRDKEKRRKRSKEREGGPEGERSENREKRERRKERSKKTQETKPADVSVEKPTDNLGMKGRQNKNNENEEIKPKVSQQEISEITSNLRTVNVNKVNESFEVKPKPTPRSIPKEETKEDRQHRSKRTNGERKNKSSKNSGDDQRRRHGNNSRIEHEDRETAVLKHTILDDNGNLKHGSKAATHQIKPKQKSSEERRKHRKERGEKSKRRSRNLESVTNKQYSITAQRATDIK